MLGQTRDPFGGGNDDLQEQLRRQAILAQLGQGAPPQQGPPMPPVMKPPATMPPGGAVFNPAGRNTTMGGATGAIPSPLDRPSLGGAGAIPAPTGGIPPFPAPSNTGFPGPKGSGDLQQTPSPGGTPPTLTRPDASLQPLYGGFDFNKDYDLADSAKGNFFYASAPGAQDTRWQHRETAGAWFDQYIRPQMEAQGFRVDEVNGDKAFVHTRENPEGTWIDWVENIDGDPAKGEVPRLAWQDQSYAGGAGGTGNTPRGGGSLTASVDQLGNSDVLAQIMRQIQGLTNGEDPMQREAVMRLLGGGPV